MSTPAGQLELAPAWKQEVNRRLAAHRRRKGDLTTEEVAELTPHRGNSRSGEVAARVAARYAAAPSYNEALDREARAAVRAARAAARAAQTAAQQARKEAEWLFAEQEAAPAVEEPAAPVNSAGGWVDEVSGWTPAAVHALECEELAGLVERDFSAEGGEASAAATAATALDEEDHEDWMEAVRFPLGDWFEEARAARAARGAIHLEAAEEAPAAHANLIEFPRELVAARKMRPRLAEGPLAETGPTPGQLSIFEVDPASISQQPEPAVRLDEPMAQAWPTIELEAQPRAEAAVEIPAPVRRARTATPRVVASVSRRLLAGVVDAALIAGASMGAAAAALYNLKELPSMLDMEMGAAAGFAAVAALYYLVFFALGAATPGMRYAQVALRTLDDGKATMAQRCGRLGALVLSLAPAGLGAAWALFDEEHLSWHDRMSGTYLARD